MKLPTIYNRLWLSLLIISGIAACQPASEKQRLPILGHTAYHEKEVGGETVLDTVYHTIDEFAFYDQDSNRVSRQTVAGKVYVADFFFTTCPSICPIMTTQMIRVFENYKNNPDFMILSHTIDPAYDTVGLLKSYANRLGVGKEDNWRFLTGTETDVYELGEKQYFASTQPDETAPGGYLHSGAFLLVDRQGRIRGHYDGTIPEQVDRLMGDVALLLAE